MHIFWKKILKIASAYRDPPLDLCVISPDYYYNFVKFVSTAK